MKKQFITLAFVELKDSDFTGISLVVHGDDKYMTNWENEEDEIWSNQSITKEVTDSELEFLVNFFELNHTIKR